MWSHNVLHSLIVLINLIPIPVTSPSTYTSNHIFLHACYDTILWDEILSGGSKMEGLRELITNVQVKKKYGKAISSYYQPSSSSW